MNRWKLLVPVAGCVAAVFVSGCATQEEVAVQAPAPAEVVVQSAPPPEKMEVVPVAPSTDHVWIRGHWHWDGVQWVWRGGQYELRRVGYRWVPARYEQRGPAFYYIPGHWGR